MPFEVIDGGVQASQPVVSNPTIEFLLSTSSSVVRGSVREVTEFHVDLSDGTRAPFTRYRLCGVDVIVGDPSDVDPEGCLELDIEGGTVGEFRHGWVGMPTLRQGEEAILFLTNEEAYVSPFTLWKLGVFRVKDLEGADYVFYGDMPLAHIHSDGRLQPGPTELTWRLENGRDSVVPFEIVAETPWTVDDFVERILTRNASLRAGLRPPGLPANWGPRALVNKSVAHRVDDDAAPDVGAMNSPRRSGMGD